MSDSIRIDVVETIESVGVTVTEQNQTAVNINEGTTWGKIIGTLADQTDLQAALDAKQGSLGYTAENAANKITAFQVTPDNTHYPSEKLVKDNLDAKSASDHNHSLNNLTEKSYNSLTDKPTIPTALFQLNDDSEHRLVTDTEKSTWNGKQDALGFTPENVANKRTSFQVTPDDTHYPSEKLVKDQLDLKIDKWNVDYLDFNLLDGFTQQKGRLQWDDENDTLQVGLNNNVNLQIGQEQLIYVYNESGADIPDGKLVYFTGVHAQRPTMALADNRNYATSLVTGMTTETIGNHSYGYVCIQGIVHGLNTHGLTAGDRLWLGQDGNYTITRPTSPLSQVRIGTILYDNPVDGEIYVYLRPTIILSDLSDVLLTNLENGNTLYYDTNVWKNTPKTRLTPEGGIAIKLTNRTGSNTIKGYCVTTDTVNDNAVKLVPIDAPNCIGVFYESGIANGAEAWVVIAGIADVYFWGSTTRGYLARTGLSTDTGEISGQALSEAVPTSPFATDKHFTEIGHCLESRTGAGLAKVCLHFN